jgi:hypothetical protein
VSAALEVAALLCTALALVCGLAALARTRDAGVALHVVLELLLAAGLLRLTGDPSWRQIVVAAVLVALRRVLSSALPPRGR